MTNEDLLFDSVLDELEKQGYYEHPPQQQQQPRRSIVGTALKGAAVVGAGALAYKHRDKIKGAFKGAKESVTGKKSSGYSAGITERPKPSMDTKTTAGRKNRAQEATNQAFLAPHRNKAARESKDALTSARVKGAVTGVTEGAKNLAHKVTAPVRAAKAGAEAIHNAMPKKKGFVAKNQYNPDGAPKAPVVKTLPPKKRPSVKGAAITAGKSPGPGAGWPPTPPTQ